MSFQITKHLEGRQAIGIYPLLKDNTSRFIVADFDKEGWQKQSKRALSVCEDFDIPAYLERSRSGNGGHIWVFFETVYPAVKSRKIIMAFNTLT
ncbi:TOTE conflict system archaeo-eukaryotic primase domain-containing protein [Sinomicrobium sp. M5D2P9]